ncbi:hypothetical protein [Cellulosimicrobium cellulans]|uniref:Uncharacterized protein n=1 Tax=Cellulosimicrobium cellulans TaxID=1710 RepID=A0A4Y4E358_CELCE|nr:hypothetical protein [Cellulosimicrobium cellulans]GED10030.1 hypothetical protein CCE02nite_20290 [Cellulosimicrobium cellulans]
MNYAVSVTLAQPATVLRVDGLGQEGMQLVPSAPASVYLSFADGFSVGFGEDGALCDIDSYLDLSHGLLDTFTAVTNPRIHALRLLRPIDADGDTISVGAASPRIDPRAGIWWCALGVPRSSVRVGKNIYALFGTDRSSLSGIAIADQPEA